MKVELLFKNLLYKEGLLQKFLAECEEDCWEAFFARYTGPYNYVDTAFAWWGSGEEDVWSELDWSWYKLLEEDTGYEKHTSNT